VTLKIGILTISDGWSQGHRQDESGEALQLLVLNEGWEVVRRAVVPDDRERIQGEILHMVDHLKVDVVLSTGGTGLGPRDVTPEAVRGVLDREVEGLGELMRHESAHHTQKAWLSRALAGSRHHSLVVCLPGSPKGAREMLGAILPLIPHAVEMLRGGHHE